MTYYAITWRNGQWLYVTSGIDPQEVYHVAIELLNDQPGDIGNEDYLVTPDAERQLDTLRVVSEEAAREQYRVSFARVGE